MLCDNCRRREVCIAHQWAQRDRRLYLLLQRLQHCEMQQTTRL